MIPASFEYTGPAFSSRDGAPFQKNDFFVTLSPSDRAIPLGLQTSSGGAAPEIATPGGFGNAADRAVLLEWVREDVAAYIEASKTGFAAYKKGDAQLSPGYRRWDSSVKPAAATGCLVVQGATTTTFSCVLSENTDLNGLRSYYAQLTKDITASLPRDWKPAVVPPFSGDLPTQGYRSSSGAHGEVWITRAKSGARYEIDFQLVSAH
jgi:hypothetical protein